MSMQFLKTEKKRGKNIPLTPQSCLYQDVMRFPGNNSDEEDNSVMIIYIIRILHRYILLIDICVL